MSKSWYIDAFDPLAGFCFASQRDPDLERDDLDLDLPAIYLAPPLFQFEIAGRASAFAATHGSFQLGLLSDGEEVEFPTLAALTEFVRRCYLSGGRTDGAGGRGPLPPPIPLEPEGLEGLIPLEPKSTAGGDAVFSVTSTAMEFVQLAEKASGTPLEFRPSPSTRKGGRVSDDYALTQIAILLTEELLRRFPRGGLGEALHLWASALSRLNRAAGQLGLLDAVWDSLLSRGLPLTSLKTLHPGSWSSWFWRQRTDSMDDLSFWPVPSILAAPGIVSVRDHLLVSTGSPQRLVGALDAALALFAASHLLQAPLPTSVSDEATTRSVQSEHFDRAADWLVAQLPTYAYRKALERMIATVGTEVIEGGTNGGHAAVA